MCSSINSFQHNHSILVSFSSPEGCLVNTLIRTWEVKSKLVVMSEVYVTQVYPCWSDCRVSLVRSLTVCFIQLSCVFRRTQMGIYTTNHMMSGGGFWILVTGTERSLKRSKTTRPPPALRLNPLGSLWLSSSISQSPLLLGDKHFHARGLRKWDDTFYVSPWAHTLSFPPLCESFMLVCVCSCSGTPAGLHKAFSVEEATTWLTELK